MKSSSPVMVICGPTAVGKSELAVWLALQLGGEILSADSQQVYSEMDIGTGKPTQELLLRVPHFGFNLLQPNEVFDAAKFQHYADEIILGIQRRGHLPLVVGGTGLYLRVLQYGLNDAAPRNTLLREQLRARIAKEGVQVLYQELQVQDPAYAASIHQHDKTRIIRALEILQAGQKPSQLFAEHTAQSSRYHLIKVGLNRPRKELYSTINQRVEKMLAQGWLNEVKNLRDKYGEHVQVFKAVGYMELLQHLRGEISLQAATELTQQRTRNYAKRQLTWFRQDAEISWFEPEQREEILSFAKDKVNRAVIASVSEAISCAQDGIATSAKASSQ